jgi:succinyl-diaminopimelate desuccinylase
MNWHTKVSVYEFRYFGMTDTLAFTQTLIRRASITPADAGCQELLAERLYAAGFKIENMPFGEVSNFWARRGETGPVFCFAGHTDVVPPGELEKWDTEPFSAEIRDGILYGRGAADMKASLAAMIDATTEFVNRHPEHKGSIAFLITSDEEGRARDGTKKVMKRLGERGDTIDWCVIGEPSCNERLGDVIRIGRRGSLSGMLTVHGKQGHVAYPHLANNPIESFAPVLADLYARELDEGNEFFPASSFQVVEIESGAGAPNVTPGTLRARFNIRYSTVWTHEQLRKFIEELLDSHGLDYTLKWHLSGEPFFTPAGELANAARDAVRNITGIEPAFSTGGGTSDGRFIAPSGTHVVEFGPVNTTIHKVNEHIPVSDIDAIRRVYFSILERMLL